MKTNAKPHRTKLWALVDRAGIYQMTVYATRREAQRDRAFHQSTTHDAKWVVVRVTVMETK